MVARALVMAYVLAALALAAPIAIAPLAPVVDAAPPALIEWTAAGGPVVLNATFAVDQGQTLRVGPGTEVRLAPGAGIVVKGTLLVEGTEAAPVTFRPVADDVVPDSWEDVRLHALSAPGAHRITHARFMGADAGLLVASCAAWVDGCTFERCRYGIIARAGADLSVNDTTFREISAAGLEWEACPVGRASDCTFEHNVAEGIYVHQGSFPTIEGCTFKDNYNHATFSEASGGLITRCRIEESSAASFECYWNSTPVLDDPILTPYSRAEVLVSNGSHPRFTGTIDLMAWHVIAVDDASYAVACVWCVVEVRDGEGRLLEGVNVTVAGASGDVLSRAVTGVDGRTPRVLLANFTKSATGVGDLETPCAVTARLGNVTDTMGATVKDVRGGVLVMVLQLEPEGPDDARAVLLAVLVVTVIVVVVAVALMSWRRRAQMSK